LKRVANIQDMNSSEIKKTLQADKLSFASLNQTRILHKRNSIEKSQISVEDQSLDSYDSKLSSAIHYQTPEKQKRIDEKTSQML
jgi:hypothetical protein